MNKLCFKLDSISLYQRGVDRFDVWYGLQRKLNQTYGEAAKELGAAIMHALACEGHLDNREKEERR